MSVIKYQIMQALNVKASLSLSLHTYVIRKRREMKAMDNFKQKYTLEILTYIYVSRPFSGLLSSEILKHAHLHFSFHSY